MKGPLQILLQRNHPQPRRFPWRRLIIILIVSILLAYGTLLAILSAGNIIPTYWFYILPPIIAFVSTILTLLSWLFPFSSSDMMNQPSQLQQPPSIDFSAHSTPAEQDISTWNVPYRRNPFFTGHEDILEYLHTTLFTKNTTTGTQAQALRGLGGIGKTQIAVEYAHRYRNEYQNVLWVNASSYETLVSDFVFLAQLLNLPEKDAQDQGITINVVKNWLEVHSQWLLILDNAEDLTITSRFLPTGGMGHILITTYTQALGPIAQGIEVQNLKPEEGALFLLHRTGTIPLNAPLDRASAEDFSKAKGIAQLLAGFPLALDQAGAYIEETRCTLSAYVDRYHAQRATLLKARGSLSTNHPESVATTFSLSLQKVRKANPAATDLLQLFAFLSPDAILEEIITEGAPHLGWTLRLTASNPIKLDAAIRELLKYSLVYRNSDRTLAIHRLVQIVLKDEMNKRTQRRWAKRAVRAISQVFPPVELATWQRCQQYLPQALECALHIEYWNMAFPEAVRLLNRAGQYLSVRAQYQECEPLYQRALAISEKCWGREHHNTANSLNNLGLLYKSQGKYEQAEPLLQRALTIKERVLGPDHLDTALSLNNLGLLYSAQGKYKQAEPLLQRALVISEKILGLDHPDTATILSNLAELYSAQGKYKQAEPLLQRALTIKEKVLGPDHPDTALSLNNLAGLYESQGKYEQAEPLLQRALTIKERVLGPDHPDTALSLNNLGLLYSAQGKYKQAEPLYQRALVITEKQLGPDHPDTALSLNNLGLLYSAQGKYKQAEPLLQRALVISEKILGLDHPDTALSLNSLAGLYKSQSRYEQAEPLYQRALVIRERMLGSDHHGTATILNNLAGLYSEQGKYKQAEPLYQRALVITEKQLGPDHPDTATSLSNLAGLYESQGKYEQAEPLYQRALTIKERVLGPDHPDTATILNNLAQLYESQDKYEQAEPLYQRALAIRERVLGPDHPNTAISLNNLAGLYFAQGKYKQAKPLYQRALAIRERILGPDHPNTATFLNNLAQLYESQGKYKQAKPLYQRALAIRERVLGPDHPDTTAVREDYADLLQKMKGKTKAEDP